jgi:hypothetical protein
MAAICKVITYEQIDVQKCLISSVYCVPDHHLSMFSYCIFVFSLMLFIIHFIALFLIAFAPILHIWFNVVLSSLIALFVYFCPFGYILSHTVCGETRVLKLVVTFSQRKFFWYRLLLLMCISRHFHPIHQIWLPIFTYPRMQDDLIHPFT